VECCVREFSEILLIKDLQSYFRDTNGHQVIKVNPELPQGFPFQTAALIFFFYSK
jgi:hypothetical protein